MKKVLLSVVLFIFVGISALFGYVWYDTENNDDWTNAGSGIDPGSVDTAYFSGNISASDDVDWFEVPLDLGNICQFDFVSYSSTGLSVDFYSDVPPVTVDMTAVPLGGSSTSTIPATATYYARVYGAAAEYPATYMIKLTNTGNTFLPVTLSHFTATFNNDGVGVTWTTQSESNLSGYNVIRSQSSEMNDAINVNGAIIVAENSTSVNTYTFRDEELEDVGEYYYWLEVIEIDGGIDYHGPVQVEISDDDPCSDTPDIIMHTGIIGSFPNPFSNQTDVEVSLAKSQSVEVAVYNIKGEKISVIHNGEMAEGSHTLNWNGKNDHGKDVANGIYLFRLHSSGGTYTHKVTFIK